MIHEINAVKILYFFGPMELMKIRGKKIIEESFAHGIGMV
jgi:hypothetical protein